MYPCATPDRQRDRHARLEPAEPPCGSKRWRNVLRRLIARMSGISRADNTARAIAMEPSADSCSSCQNRRLVSPFTGLTRLHVRRPTTAGRKTSVILSLIRGQKPLAVSAQARWRDRLRFHDFRHDFGTKLLRATGNLKLVQRALNHTNIKTTTRYAHVLDDQVATPWSA